MNVHYEVCSHGHACREPFILHQLLLATNLRLPIFLESAPMPSLASWPPVSPTPAYFLHRSALILTWTLQRGKLQQHLAASNIKNSDWLPKPCEMWSLLTFLAGPYLPIPHLSLCLSSDSLQQNPLQCYKGR